MRSQHFPLLLSYQFAAIKVEVTLPGGEIGWLNGGATGNFTPNGREATDAAQKCLLLLRKFLLRHGVGCGLLAIVMPNSVRLAFHLAGEVPA